MPTYDYQCRSCGSMTEVIHSMLEEGPTVCERCGGQLRRVIHASGIIFKGSGFYRTDSRADSQAKSTGDGSSSSSTPTPSAKPADTAGGSTKSEAGSGS